MLAAAAVACALALVAAAPAGATTLMTEDGVLSDAGTVNPDGVTPDLVDFGYSVSRYMGARMIRYTRGLQADVPGSFALYYSRVERWVGETRRHGFEPYLTITQQPVSGLVVPTARDFGAFCGEIGKRFHGRISHYGVWNEPNTAGADTYVDPARYNALYRACYSAIKRVSPEARVLYGEIDAHRPDPCGYVQRSLRGGPPTVADGIAIHTYQWTVAPERAIPGSTACQGIGRLDDWNAARRRWHRDGSLRTPAAVPAPLSITEHGYCSQAGECPPGAGGTGARLDEATRADYARRSFLWAQSRGVELFSYYHLFSNQGAAAAPDQWDSGIVPRSPTGPASASVSALRRATGTRSGAAVGLFGARGLGG